MLSAEDGTMRNWTFSARRVCAASLLATTLASVVAHAEPKADVKPTPGAAAATPPVSSDPQATSATYGDWVLVCQRVADEVQSRLCEVSQAVQVQGQPGPIAQIAISRTKNPAAVRLTVVLPSNVLLTAAPRVAVDETDPLSVDLAWARCLPGGCFADVAIKDEVLAKWRSQTDRGRLDFKDGVGRGVTIPFSFRGLGPAYDALSKD